ncbi:MAG: minichromosome maintenance protein MCM [Candidatus Woesearchaeota archaeon]
MEISEQIEKFKEFIELNYLKDLHKQVRKGRGALVIDFSELVRFDPELAEQLLAEPEDCIKAAEMAVDQFDLGKSLRVRFRNLPDSEKIEIKNIRSEHLGLFIAFDGIVRQASDVRPQVVSAKFECPSCGNNISILQVDTKFKEPTRCSCGRRGKFRLLNKSLVDAQRLVIEESPESLVGGEQPKRLSVFLREDLVEPIMEKKTTPGSLVRITGVLKEVPVFLRTGAQSIRYDLMLESNFIEPVEETFEETDIGKEDEEEILRLARDPKVYEKFRNSIAPTIYGHEDIKEALVLMLMGGVKKERADGTMVKGDVHVLIVGDPGSAKSMLLTYISKNAPRARYIAGKGASGAGISASVVKDEFLKGWALEAGALVLANKGFLLLDEMDKMAPEDTSALHEAMAQQQVTIAKANIQATLRAETTVLAAANPKLGRFDPYQPVAGQIDMPPALINRFDLIFPVRDVPAKDTDTKIASHVLELQYNRSLGEPEIDKILFKKYISYVRQKIFPKLDKGAMDEIKDFYVSLRNSGSFGEEQVVRPIPITARQLEALIRLAEASARVRLSNKANRSDARRAIRILKYCLHQVGVDPETGQIDIDRISTGITASQRNKILVVKDLIVALEKSLGKKAIPLEDIISEAANKNLSESDVEEAINKLKREGEIFEPRKNVLSRV